MHGGSVFFRNDMVDCCMHIFNAFPDAMQIEEIPRDVDASMQESLSPINELATLLKFGKSK